MIKTLTSCVIAALMALTLPIGAAKAGDFAARDRATRAEMRAGWIERMQRAPGSFVGDVPGGYLTAAMRPIPPERLESLPVYDINRLCEGDRGCLLLQQDYYDEIKYVLDSLPVLTK